MLPSELESNEREATNLYGDFPVYIISCNIPKISKTVYKMSVLNSDISIRPTENTRQVQLNPNPNLWVVPQLPHWCLTICSIVSVTKAISLIRCVQLREKREKKWDDRNNCYTNDDYRNFILISIFISNGTRSTFFLLHSFQSDPVTVRTLLPLSLTFENLTLK